MNEPSCCDLREIRIRAIVESVVSDRRNLHYDLGAMDDRLTDHDLILLDRAVFHRESDIECVYISVTS